MIWNNIWFEKRIYDSNIRIWIDKRSHKLWIHLALHIVIKKVYCIQYDWWIISIKKLGINKLDSIKTWIKNTNHCIKICLNKFAKIGTYYIGNGYVWENHLSTISCYNKAWSIKKQRNALNISILKKKKIIRKLVNFQNEKKTFKVKFDGFPKRKNAIMSPLISWLVE